MFLYAMRIWPRSRALLVAALFVLVQPFDLCAQIPVPTPTPIERGVEAFYRISEQLSIQQIALKHIACNETIDLTRFDKKGKERERARFRMVLNADLVKQGEVAATDALIEKHELVEELSASKHYAAQNAQRFLMKGALGLLPKIFSMDNKFSLALQYLSEEEVRNRVAQRFSFRTIKHLLPETLELAGEQGNIDQSGNIWIDPRRLEVLKLEARQAKMPKKKSIWYEENGKKHEEALKSYRYLIEFQTLSSGRSVTVPENVYVQLTFGDGTRFDVSQKLTSCSF